MIAPTLHHNPILRSLAPFRALVGPFGLGLLLGTALASCASPPRSQPAPDLYDSAAFLGAPIELPTSPELERIAELEDARSTGEGQLFELAIHADAKVRRRAIVALGRLPFPEYGAEVTGALSRALADPTVRVAAAFALGLRGDPAGGGNLIAYLHDGDAKLRSVVVEAASRLPGDRLHQEILGALQDPDLDVRIAAGLGTALWKDEGEAAKAVDRALIDTLVPYSVRPGRATSRTAVEAELVWRILYALERRGSASGRGAFLEYGDSDVPLERLFALRGLGHLAASDEALQTVLRALTGPDPSSDWRVAYEATVALAAFADPAGLPGIEAAAEHSNVHVRTGAMGALAVLGGSSEVARAVRVAKRGLADVSDEVSHAALIALAGLLSEGEAINMVERALAENEPLARLACVDALSGMNAARAAAPLMQLAADSELLVATRATEALGEHINEAVRTFLHGRLAATDNGVRLAAVMALRMNSDATDVAPLIEAFKSSTGDISSEVAFNVLTNLGKLTEEAAAREFVRRAMIDRRPFVRDTARRVMADDFGVAMGVTEVPPRPAPEAVPIPGRDFPQWTHNPLVEMVTNRGKLLFELFPAEAPLHVVSFMNLADKGAYDGLTFHRVVPDFVIQGGDYRGDGNGARPWRGDSLRQEFGPRRYVTGSLGMPRNQDPDSGGGQFFVTHRPTPHLDGRYTIFGELRAGRSVLDSIEVGDRILSTRLLAR